MDLTTTTITLGSIIAIVGCLIGVLNFFANRNKNTKADEARLIRMEKDLLYIREKIDDFKGTLTNHENRINNCEKEIIKIKGRKR